MALNTPSFLATIRYIPQPTDGYQSLSTGLVYQSNRVLTTAHQLHDINNPQLWEVYLEKFNRTELARPERFSRQYSVRHINVHPDYRARSEVDWEHNLAIVTLDRNVGTMLTSQITLDRPGNSWALQTDRPVTLMGWDRLGRGMPSDKLGHITACDEEELNSYFSRANNMCVRLDPAHRETDDALDVGSPILLTKDYNGSPIHPPRLIGLKVTSYSVKVKAADGTITSESKTFAMRVQNYYQWIMNNSP